MKDDHTIHVLSAHRVFAVPEMLDAIFSHLHLPLKWDIGSDRSALRACTLVSHQWSNIAQPHLWSALSFRVITSGAVDEEDRRMTPSSLDDLYEFLTWEAPTICRSVRSLRLEGHYGHIDDYVSVATLYLILCILPALQHLFVELPTNLEGWSTSHINLCNDG